jgi:hypothetical protein
MIRRDVLKWGAVILLVVFSLMLLPAYEYFKPDEPIASTLGVTPLSIHGGGAGHAPSCEWREQPNAAVPDNASSYLTGMEYKVLEKAKLDCSMDPQCKGVQAILRNGIPTYLLTATSRADPVSGRMGTAFYEKKDCSRDPQDAPCQWGEEQKDRAPKHDTLNHFFPTLYTAKIGCYERSDCTGITKDDKDNFYYLSNDSDLHEKKGKTYYKKVKCPHKHHDDDGGGGGGSGGGGDCSWPAPTAHRQIQGGQTALIPMPPFNSRNEAQQECAKKSECKGVARFGDWFGLSKTTETSHNEGEFDFTEKPGGCGDSQPKYSPGPSTSFPPIDNILGGDKADSSDGTKAGAGYGPGAMYGKDKPSKPWFQGSDEDNYVAKSSLVPCTCTTHSMGCAKHSGGRDQSKAPGDMDGAMPNQGGIMKPFSRAFENQEEPSGFLNTFNAFMR